MCCVQSLSHVQLFVTPWTIAHQAPLPVEYSRQEYWREEPFPLPKDLPNPETEPTSPLSPTMTGGFFTLSQLGSPKTILVAQISMIDLH